MENQTIDEEYDLTSFKNYEFESEEMKKLLRIEYVNEDEYKRVQYDDYSPNKVIPDWILKDQKWSSMTTTKNANKIADIAKVGPRKTNEQISTLVQWITSCWDLARQMDPEKCNALVQAFRYQPADANKSLIREGDACFSFYIIINGTCEIIKGGSVIGHLSADNYFCEGSLIGSGTYISDVTVKTCNSKVDLFTLNKSDYDSLMKAVQTRERKENYHCLRMCKLFENWSRVKIERLCDSCSRKILDATEFVFKQGDEPDYLYFILKGRVEIIKEVHILRQNRWPESNSTWRSFSCRDIKKFPVCTISQNQFFGELAFLNNTLRNASVVTKERCVFLCVQKQDFLQLLKQDRTIELLLEHGATYTGDTVVKRSLERLGLSNQTIVSATPPKKIPNTLRPLVTKDIEASSSLPTLDTESLLTQNSVGDSADSDGKDMSVKDEVERRSETPPMSPVTVTSMRTPGGTIRQSLLPAREVSGVIPDLGRVKRTQSFHNMSRQKSLIGDGQYLDISTSNRSERQKNNSTTKFVDRFYTPEYLSDSLLDANNAIKVKKEKHVMATNLGRTNLKDIHTHNHINKQRPQSHQAERMLPDWGSPCTASRKLPGRYIEVDVQGRSKGKPSLSDSLRAESRGGGTTSPLMWGDDGNGGGSLSGMDSTIMTPIKYLSIDRKSPINVSDGEELRSLTSKTRSVRS